MKVNELKLNNVSSAGFPFDVYITKNDGYRVANNKNRYFTTPYSSGSLRIGSHHYEPKEKTYELYAPQATLKDMRSITTWLMSVDDNGKLVASDEPDLFYEVIKVNIEPSLISPVSGYRVTVTFLTQPFGYETVKKATLRNNTTLFNHTNAPMYPRILIYGNSTPEQVPYLAIGSQTVRFKEILTGKPLLMECKMFHQNLMDQYSNPMNSLMRGDFFEVLPGANRVIMDEGITSIEMTQRWGWL